MGVREKRERSGGLDGEGGGAEEREGDGGKQEREEGGVREAGGRAGEGGIVTAGVAFVGMSEGGRAGVGRGRGGDLTLTVTFFTVSVIVLMGSEEERSEDPEEWEREGPEVGGVTTVVVMDEVVESEGWDGVE